jgi:hypothetical protein
MTLTSALFPVGFALLREGAGPFQRVLAAAHRLGLGILQAEGDVQGVAQPQERGLLARADRDRRAFQDLVGPSQRGRHQLPERPDLVDDAEPPGLPRGHVPAGENGAHRDLLLDHPRQPVHAAGARHAAGAVEATSVS